MELFSCSAGSDDLGDSLRRTISLRQAAITHRMFSHLSVLSSLTCSRQEVAYCQREVSNDMAEYSRFNSKFYVTHKWDVLMLPGYSILRE
jgi:hypothetical protein